MVEEVTDVNFHHVNVLLVPAELDAGGEAMTPAPLDPENN